MRKNKKKIFTTDEFDQLSWHDVTIKNVSFINKKFELLFEIDFILDWLHPKSEIEYFKFNVAKASLLFENVYDLQIEINTDANVRINEVSRSKRSTNKNTGVEEWVWLLDCIEGSIKFISSGFVLELKSNPIISETQNLDG